LYGVFAGFAAGIIKELVDKNPDPMDAYFTMWGSTIGGAVITIPINNKKCQRQIQQFGTEVGGLE
jgi:hypothetical protein